MNWTWLSKKPLKDLLGKKHRVVKPNAVNLDTLKAPKAVNRVTLKKKTKENNPETLNLRTLGAQLTLKRNSELSMLTLVVPLIKSWSACYAMPKPPRKSSKKPRNFSVLNVPRGVMSNHIGHPKFPAFLSSGRALVWTRLSGIALIKSLKAAPVNVWLVYLGLMRPAISRRQSLLWTGDKKQGSIKSSEFKDFLGKHCRCLLLKPESIRFDDEGTFRDADFD